MPGTLRNRKIKVWNAPALNALWGLLLIAGSLLAQGPRGGLNPPPLPTGTPGASPSKNATIPFPAGSPSLAVGTWTAIGPAALSAGNTVSGRITGIAVDPTTDQTIYIAAAGGGVWKTTNGGSSWSPLTDTQSTLATGAIAISPTNNQKIYAGGGEANNSGDSNFGYGILHSENAGASWTLATGPSNAFTRLAVGKISVDPSVSTGNTAYAAINDYAENGLCCSNTGVYKTTDGGATWTNVTSANSQNSSSPWSDVVVDPNNTQIVYAAVGDPFGAAANGVYRSADGGSTWSLLANAPSGSGIGRIGLTVAPSATTSGAHVLYVAVVTQISTGTGGLSGLYVSNNADAATPTFSQLTNAPDFCGGGNGSGQGWYDLTLLVNPNNKDLLYAAGVITYGSGNKHVIKTANGTAGGSTTTFTDITTGANSVAPHTDSHATAFLSTGDLLLGNDGGIFQYGASSGNWTSINGNLNTIQFVGIGLHPTTAGTVVGGSQDNGTEVYSNNVVWTETDGGDGGQSLISQQNGSVMYSVHPIGSFGVGSFMRVSTNGGSVWNSAVPLNVSGGHTNFYPPIFLDPTNGQHIFLGSDTAAGSMVFESTNSGTSWTGHATADSGNAVDTIAATGSGATVKIYAATGGTFASTSNLWFSSNDGSTWTQINLGGGSSGSVGGRVNEIDIDPNDATGATAFAVVSKFNGGAGQVFRTTNSGTNWTNISGNLASGPVWSIKIDTDASKTAYISTEAGVYSSPSPYSTWTLYGTGLPNAQGLNLQLVSSQHLLGVGTHGRGTYLTLTPSTSSASVLLGFGSTTLAPGATTLMTVTIANSNASTAFTGGAFTMNLNGIQAAGGSVGGTCTGTSPSSVTAGTTALSFSAISIPANSSCTVTLTVKGAITGSYNESTSGVSTTQAAAGSGSTIVPFTVGATTVTSIKVNFGSTSYTVSGSGRVHLPWTITGLTVVFSTTMGTANAASLSGISATGFSGLGTNTLTWTFAGLSNATVTATLTASAIQDSFGNLLNGGTNVQQALKVLYGDFNDDGYVSASDLAAVNAARSQGYNIFADVNGDGVVNTTDVIIVRSLIGSSNP